MESSERNTQISPVITLHADPRISTLLVQSRIGGTGKHCFNDIISASG
jgi:hypothetical protein